MMNMFSKIVAALFRRHLCIQHVTNTIILVIIYLRQTPIQVPDYLWSYQVQFMSETARQTRVFRSTCLVSRNIFKCPKNRHTIIFRTACLHLHRNGPTLHFITTVLRPRYRILRIFIPQ